MDFVDVSVYVVNIGMGNSKSVDNMLNSIGIKSEIVESTKAAIEPSGLVIPGVGNFDAFMKKLKITGWASFIKDAFQGKQYPVLGICVGMQVFCEGSEEGIESGIGLIPGYLKKFNFSDSENIRKVPHMGWDRISFKDEKLNEIYGGEKAKYYFLHSYYYPESTSEQIIAFSHYGIKYASVVGRDKVFGVQFHPEKSHNFGKKLLKYFFEKQTIL